MAKGKYAVGALIGAFAGFVTGVLLAPKSGKETREEIKVKANKAKDEAVIKAKDIRKKAGDAAEDAIEKTEKVAGKTADNFVSATKHASGAVVDTTKDLKSKSSQAAKSAKSTIEKNK